MPTPFTVAICTLNRAEHLEACLDGLVRQVEAPADLDILVVDNGSTDDTFEVVESYLGNLPLRYLLEPRTGLSHARNAALAATEAEWIVYLDDDAIPAPGWMTAIAQGLQTWSPDLFGGPIVPHYQDPKPAWFDDRYGSAHLELQDGPLPAFQCLSGGNMGWRRGLLLRRGGFDPALGMVGGRLRLGEETAIQARLWREEPGLVRIALRGMRISHLVPAGKMSLGYIGRRSWTYGRQLGAIDPENRVWRRASLLHSCWQVRFGLPLLLKASWYAISRRRPWQAYAADWLSLHAIHFGAAFEKKALV